MELGSFCIVKCPTPAAFPWGLHIVGIGIQSHLKTEHVFELLLCHAVLPKP